MQNGGVGTEVSQDESPMMKHMPMSKQRQRHDLKTRLTVEYVGLGHDADGTFGHWIFSQELNVGTKTHHDGNNGQQRIPG